jgi:peptide/nickel transport system substrate-binding protein
LYGAAGDATSNWLVAPDAFVSPNTSFEFDIDGAAALLDEAGWVLEGNQRAKDGVQMSILYQTSVNSLRQRTQEIIKQACESIGIPVEIKAIEASVYFSSDAGNPDTLSHFYADWEMYTNGPSTPYPIGYAEEGLSANPDTDLAQKSNNWAASNALRWQNAEYNEAYAAAQTELDADAQAELFITMNDLIVNEGAIIPLVHRASVSARGADLDVGSPSRWTSELYDIANWRRNE